MLTAKKELVLNEILNYIKENNLSSGQSLPPERKLAEVLNTSRNTIREVLRALEERGIVEIIIGSGCYIRSIDNTESDCKRECRLLYNNSDVNLIMDRIVSCYVLLPEIMAFVLERIENDTIQLLEHALVELSKAILERDYNAIITNDTNFNSILVESADNRVMAVLMRQLGLLGYYSWDIAKCFSDDEINEVFASYVAILNALRKREGDSIRTQVRKNIILLTKLLMKYSNMNFPDDFVATLEALPQKGGVLAGALVF